MTSPILKTSGIWDNHHRGSIGEFLKAQISHSGRRIGLRNAEQMKYGKAYGAADHEMIEGDVFQIIVKCPYFEARHTDSTDLRLESRLELRLESRLAAKIILLVKHVEAGKTQLATGLGYKTVSGELRKQIRRLLDLELIEMTIPDKPKSRFAKVPAD